MATAIVNRADRRHYMNTGTKETPVWSAIGEGFTEFAETKNATSYQRRYIHEATKRTDVTGYAPVIDYECEVYRGSATIGRLRKITDTEALGEAAQVEICTVDLFDETETAGVYRALRRTYSVIPDKCASGVDALFYTGTLKAVSSPIPGTFVVSTETFTAD